MNDLPSHQDVIRQGRSQAIQWLGLDKKPSGRVAAYLSDKGFDEQTVVLILDGLKIDGYIADDLLAKQVVRKRQGRFAESRAALYRRMIRLGIEKETVLKSLECAPDDYDAACDLIRSRFSPLNEKTDPETSDKMFRKFFMFLQRRGFGREISLRALADAGLTIDKYTQSCHD